MHLNEIALFVVAFLTLLSSGYSEYIKLTEKDGLVLYESNIANSSDCQNRPIEWITESTGIESGYKLILYSELDCMSSHLLYTTPGVVMS